MLHEQFAAVIDAAPLSNLDNLARDLWKAHGAGAVGDNNAQALAERIQSRRVAARERKVETATAPLKRAWSYFPPKRRVQQSPDRAKSWERRRRLAASGPMPPTLAARFTTGEQAVLRIIADDVAAFGSCAKSVPEIAARAGVGQTVARGAIRVATRFGLLTVEERRRPKQPNLTNLVRVISPEWLAWLAKAGGRVRKSAGHGYSGLTKERNGWTASPPEPFWRAWTRHSRPSGSPPYR